MKTGFTQGRFLAVNTRPPFTCSTKCAALANGLFSLSDLGSGHALFAGVEQNETLRS